MSCDDANDLTAYMDGELPPARDARVRAHLEACAACRTTEALLRTTVARLAELPAFEPSPATRRAVLATLDALPVSWPERMRTWLRPAVLWPSAGLVAVLAVSLLMPRPGPDAPLALEDASVMELAVNLELAEDYELLGLDSMADLEVVANLHELEVVR
ncbi:zf-HC2 domain-containing protein [Myxococcus sp. AM009]|uniref:anti-sigma factor family protein n=1 Tax=Myxococcus sp. AM009 TaxID=2745137 RepID=UPI001595BF2F|nr:zf-HC2 domain-containing protein [Myxococcus sp. AM009]NVI98413.1 zf-HC2 domain-containing protein [Myxococcus sp. AM009]